MKLITSVFTKSKDNQYKLLKSFSSKKKAYKFMTDDKVISQLHRPIAYSTFTLALRENKNWGYVRIDTDRTYYVMLTELY